ncbi:DNA-directed DNA polymerase [Tanacetum coccineum]
MKRLSIPEQTATGKGTSNPLMAGSLPKIKATYIMDPNSSIGRICLGEDNRISLNDEVESHGEWDTPECYDIANSWQKKEAKDKVAKKELIVALRGEIYFVKFIINPKEDDIEPKVVFGRSFMRLTKGIADFGNRIITTYLDLDHFLDDSNKYDDSGDDWVDILEVIDFGDIPEIEGIDVPPYVCKIRKSSRSRKSHVPRPIIETVKFIDQHKKLLESVMLDKLKLDEEVEADEEEATKEKINSFALVETGSNINVLPYQLYTKLVREEVKPVGKKITMLDYSKAELIGILRDVVCQVGVTIILAKFLIFDIPVDKDVPIVMGRSFLYTCGGIINTIKGITSTFDGICHQRFYAAAVKPRQEKIDSEEEKEYSVKRDKNGKPFYGPTTLNYLNYDDPLDRALSLQGALNPFKNTVGTHDDEATSSRPKRTCQHKTVEAAMLPCFYNEFLLWGSSNRAAKNDELITKKLIKFRLCGRGHTLTLLEFARRLGLYHVEEINEEEFEVYFQGGLHSDENFNAIDYWLSISSEENLHLSRSLASTIRSPILRVLQKMITYGPAPGVPRVAMSRGLHPSMQDLYDRMGNMEIRQRTLESMAHRQLYHTDRYARLFEHMAGHYGYTLLGDYEPPRYDEE